MWKKIENPSEIKKVPVGSKVRINGKENTLTSHYRGNDNGFDVKNPIYTTRFAHSSHIFASGEYDKSTVEYWSNSFFEPPYTDEITIEEFPNDCVVTGHNGQTVHIRSPKDALILSDSLALMAEIQGKPKRQSFSCYRYTRVPGPEANNYPSLAWKFVCEGDQLYFAVARCSENDQFSYQQARNILDKRIIFDYYHIERSDASLVEDALRALEGTPGQFENRVVRDYYRLREIIDFGSEIPF